MRALSSAEYVRGGRRQAALRCRAALLPAPTTQGDEAKILKYHVVAGHVTVAQLAVGKPLTTLEGSTLKPSKMGAVYEVNTADVICGNVQTANATVYIINKVLTPMH